MAGTALAELELIEVARRIKSKDLSPVDLTETMLQRIADLDGALASYALVTADLARAQARQAEREIAEGTYRGPLHGVPIAVKDLCCTRGIATAAGTTIYKPQIPDDDATAVARLNAAGAVLLGKLQMTEGAFSGHHPTVTVPKNPWGTQYWAGASSSGSGVATAASLCYGSLGSDTGGSIRFPSAANGCTGLKPTYGRVSRYGVFDLAPSLDHLGPMARSAADCAAILGVIAGADPNDPTAAQVPVPDYMAALGRPVGDIRLGVCRRYISEDVDAPTRAATEAAIETLRGLGMQVVDIDFPDVRQVAEEWLLHCAVETAYVHRRTYPARKAEYGPELAGLIELGRAANVLDYQAVLGHRALFNGRLQATMRQCDLVIMPAMVNAAPTTEQMAALGSDPKAIHALMRFTGPIDYAGVPALTLPGGVTAAGAPVCFQLVGRHFEEDVVLRAGHAFQGATDWHKARPPL